MSSLEDGYECLTDGDSQSSPPVVIYRVKFLNEKNNNRANETSQFLRTELKKDHGVMNAEETSLGCTSSDDLHVS